jgi:hypothetical protein
VSTVVFDASDPIRVADFWAEVLGWKAHPPDEEGYVVVAPVDVVAPFILLFIHVPEPKVAKNRVHLDLNPVGVDEHQELERLLCLGARRVDIGQREQPWHVLADPEGNEFCLLIRRIEADGSAGDRR